MSMTPIDPEGTSSSNTAGGGVTSNPRWRTIVGRIRTPRASAYGILGVLLLLLLTTWCTGPGEPSTDGGAGQSRSELSASQLKAPLSGAYKVKPDGSRVPPRQEELPVPLDTVEAHWYRSGGVYVVVFGGLDLDETGSICPGSSIQTDAGFEHVTNSPTEDGACEGAPTVAGSGAGVRACGPLLLYITAIPEKTEGDLFASVERYARSGKIIGVTGVVAADMSAAPEIDPEADRYALQEGMIEGTTEVTC
jgi:hypothetical protein